MNPVILDSLIGLSLEDAENKVIEMGYEVDSMPVGTITAAVTRPDNVIELYYNDNKIIVRAFNQEVTDRKFV